MEIYHGPLKENKFQLFLQ